MSSAALTACSGSSSCAVLAPQTAMIASPMCLSTRPSLARTTSSSSAHTRFIRSASCSASSRSDIAVNPRMSANKIVTWRRLGAGVSSSGPARDGERRSSGRRPHREPRHANAPGPRSPPRARALTPARHRPNVANHVAEPPTLNLISGRAGPIRTGRRAYDTSCSRSRYAIGAISTPCAGDRGVVVGSQPPATMGALGLGAVRGVSSEHRRKETL